MLNGGNRYDITMNNIISTERYMNNTLVGTVLPTADIDDR